jgi:superfamily I DNA/RNA helicase
MSSSRYDAVRDRLPRPVGEQVKVVALTPSGHHVVLGTAGSGKTTMAMLRALFLSDPRTDHCGRTLLVTYNRALLAFLGQVIIDTELLEVRNFHRFALGYLQARGRPTNNAVVGGRRRENLIAAAIDQQRIARPREAVLRRDLSFFDAEIDWMGRHGVTDVDTYRAIERVGRLQPLASAARPAVFAVREAYEQLRVAAGFHYDWEDVATAVVEELARDDEPRRFQHIVIDEGQDFSLQMLRSLVAATAPGGSVTFFGDAAQQIYGRGVSWRSAGLRVSRIWEFAHNYRNSPQIAALGQAIAAMPYFNDAEDLVDPDEFSDEGPPPTLVRFEDGSAERSWIVQQATALGRVGTTGVLFHRRADAERFLQACPESKALDRDTPEWSPEPGIWASTVHSAKGYEFQSVILSGLSQDRWPEPEAIRGQGEEEARAIDGPLLYVAVTRARQNLIMTTVGSLTDLMPANDGLWIERRL